MYSYGKSHNSFPARRLIGPAAKNSSLPVDGTFEAALRRGAALALPAALAYAIDEPGEPVTSGRRLTRREQEVADLVAAGLSNKEIAAKLVIAQRTAENHVERVLTKLGLTSRAQLAVWIHEQRAQAH